MGALPKQRISRAHQGNRRRHHFLVKPSLVECPYCHQMKRNHYVCAHCGMYRGRQVIEIEERRRAEA